MPPKQFKKSFAAQGKLEQQQRERSIREKESHLKAKTYLEHLAVDYIMKTVVFENAEQLPPFEEMKNILVMALKTSLARQQSETMSSYGTTNTVYSEIEKYIDEYTEFLISVLKREIKNAASEKHESTCLINFNIKEVKPLTKNEGEAFSEAMNKISLVDLVTK
ncbi:hypothetical protein FDP41_012238 [Naegleria fowleri]|uniref:Uncharacterized protein n=1 Tax=Naegleria fowleri TaxID=5763 RepID=A0A6A5C3E3_NAEFO|nr:uncharacterized protein FDP41_012238 [Naegleria fowleri]KAF0981581.1 hypothetical protein FDP41_012238 [Naegleria fowleri]CAG4716533.1 unnamed protein product [Naegleria fowleri]